MAAASRCLFSASFRRRRNFLRCFLPLQNIQNVLSTGSTCPSSARIARTNISWTCGGTGDGVHISLVGFPGRRSGSGNSWTCTRYVSSTQNTEADRSKASFEEEDSADEKARKQAEESKKKAEFQKKATKYALLGMTVALTFTAGSMIATWGAPPKDEEGNLVKDQFSDMPTWKAYLYRTRKEMVYYDKMIKEPSRDKLLPDPLQEPYFQPPFTLAIEMTGVLVHPDWTGVSVLKFHMDLCVGLSYLFNQYKTGWRFKKRPGVDFFLHQAGPPLFEIVVYTFEQGLTAFPIIDSLDPDGCVMYRLFRDATRYVNGHHVKDLSCLNRDLSRVIFVDWNEKSFQLQPENALKLKKWTGSDDDTALFDLAMFMRTIAMSEVEDVRTVLSYYKQFDDPLLAFKENQRRLQEEQDRLNQHRLEQIDKPQSLTGSWSSGLFGRRR